MLVLGGQSYVNNVYIKSSGVPTSKYRIIMAPYRRRFSKNKSNLNTRKK